MNRRWKMNIYRKIIISSKRFSVFGIIYVLNIHMWNLFKYCFVLVGLVVMILYSCLPERNVSQQADV